MKLSCQEGMVPGGSLKEKVAKLEEYGFEGIEFGGAGLAERREEIIEATKGSRAKPSSVCAGYRGCLLSPKAEERDLAVRDIEELLGICADIGAVGLIVVPIFGGPQLPDLSPYRTTLELERGLLVELLAKLSNYAEKVGSVILLEPLNRYETHFINRLEQGVDVVNKVGSPGLKIMADFFHMNIEERDIPEAILKAGNLIYHIHLADSTRFLPGFGHTDFKSSFQALKKIGYDKYMAMECRVPGDPEVELPKSARYLRQFM